MPEEELVRKITQEVVSELDNRKSGSSQESITNTDTGGNGPGAGNSGATSRVLVLLLSGQDDHEEVQSQLKQLGQKNVLIDLIMSNSLPESQRQSYRELPGVDAVYESQLPEEGCFSLVSRCDGVLIPALSMDSLGQINEMDGQDLPSRVAVEALSQGKSVVTAEQGGVSTHSTEIRNKYEEKLNEAENLGLRSAPLHELSYELLQSTVDGGTMTEVQVSREQTDGDGGSGVSLAANEEGTGAVVEGDDMRLATTIGVRDVKQEVAGYIDHTLLNPDATRDEIVQLCEEAEEFKFVSVCINPSWVGLCSDLLKGTDVRVCTVIGFPLGATTTATKVQETREAIANGADEIDMVMNIGALKEGDHDYVRRDVAAVADATGNRVLKVILETGMLDDSQKAEASRLCKQAGANFVKTSTGFGPGGAKMNDIALMRRVVGEDMGVKASGGVHNFKEAVDMIAAGASRIGASAGVAIVSGEESDSDY